MRARLPQFSPQRTPWGKLFRLPTPRGPDFFVLMYTDRNEDVFQVEAGWGADERAFVELQLIRNREAIDVRLDGSRFVLSCLWDDRDPRYTFGVGRPSTSGMPWTPIPEDELLPVARQKAAFAVQQIVEHAVPIFRAVAAAHGQEGYIHDRPERNGLASLKN